MLGFFHSLNAILWYDVPSLRELVILDPKWVLDAATSFIRDFKLKDHTERYERMQHVDQDAMRREPDAWSLLTDGAATLSRSLLNIFWQDDDFEPHKAELLDLLTRFGLLVPVPLKSDAWLVPALLRETRRPDPPFGWPSRPPEAARLLLHFSLVHEYGDLLKLSTLVCEPEASASGFLPVGVFHRLSAGALGSSHQGAGGVECTLERKFAYVAFESELLILQHMPDISSIMVYFHTAGARTGAGVLDRLRVLLAQELGEYRNLKCRVLAPFEGEAKQAWVELDVLAQTPSTIDEAVAVGGSQRTIAELRTSLEFWLTFGCEFVFLRADKLRDASLEQLPKMLSLQQIAEQFPDWIVRKQITLAGICRNEYAAEYLAVSHRWGAISEPDAGGDQLRLLKQYLASGEQPQVKYVFVSFMCLHQGLHRTPAERSDFTRTLPNIALVFLGCRVLLMLDRGYTGRFWTMFECWLSLQKPSKDGLIAAPAAEQRCTIYNLPDKALPPPVRMPDAGSRASLRASLSGSRLSGTPRTLQSMQSGNFSHPAQTLDAIGDALRSEWREYDTDAAYYRLSQPGVVVANASDREVQLTKLLQFNELAKRVMSNPTIGSQGNGAGPSAAASMVASVPSIQVRGDEKEEVDALIKMFSSGSSPSHRTAGSSNRASPAAVKTAPRSAVKGLETLLEGLNLEDDVGTASAWCAQQGIDSISELKEAEMESEFAVALALKPAKQKLLLKRIAEQ